MPRPPSEAEWQAQVVQLANMGGWRHMHVRRTIGKGNRWTTGTSVAGWPDLTLWKADRLIFAELKTDKGKVTADQRAILDSLEAAGADVYVWRPSDADHVAQVLLRGDGPRPTVGTHGQG